MASGVGDCLSTVMFASVYKGLNEISRSSHPGRGGGYFPAHFLYAWSAKNFDACELTGEASSSPGVVKFSGIGRAKSFQLEEARELIEPFVRPIEDGSSHVKIPGTHVVIPATPIPVFLIQSIAPLPQEPIGVCEPSTEKVIELPPEGVGNIIDILDTEPDLAECMVEYSIHRVNAPSLVPRLQRSLRAPQRGISVFNADAVIKEVDKNAARVFGNLDKASRRLNNEGAHYEAKAAELKQVELRREELLKELQLLKDQKKDLSSQAVPSEHLLQKVEREVIDLQGQINILNATKVMDAVTKASLDKAEAYIKQSFEDLKNFQWDP
ncbi:hypothetical protein Cgig2_033468 [Carnegiea gigantea]|uniref:Uncharacterized protein n=1 Tax=Carnegiea gigantea TaxID=171969 RepID=A0A9Q1GRQ0_9CARY|nr:hypothetical protein Cgig2_033468 [Carnegiea gigantea]